MGVVGSKSTLERRNTVLRRSQRKSIHGIKGKTDKLVKDIKKFKGTEENAAFVELKTRIETLERDLNINGKNLQPQIRNVHNETLKKTQECYKLLEDKLKENQEKENAKEKKKEDSDEDDVFVEEINERQALEESTEKRKTVELTLVQVTPIEASPQVNKRASIMKIGVPVMPGVMMEAIHRKTLESETGVEEKVMKIRQKIEDLELEISRFVGKKKGRHYKKLKGQLEGYLNDLQTLSSVDDAIVEQVNLCRNYIMSCLSFLDEKAVESDSEDDYDEVPVSDPDYDEVPTPIPVSQNETNNFSPRSMRTTYI